MMVDKMVVLKKVHVWAFARMHMFIFAVIGFVLGIWFAFGAFNYTSMLASTDATFSLPFPAGLFFIFYPIGLLIVMGVCGIIFGALVAWLYNLFAGWVGGFKFELVDKK
jgi:hypothetical protein